MHHPLRRLTRRTIALDLGNAFTRLSSRAHELALEQPSVVAFRDGEPRPLAVGDAAKRMAGRTPPGISVVRPLRGGAIHDPRSAQWMVAELIRRALGGRTPAFDVVATIPLGTTGPERRALEQTVASAGARRSWILEEPMAAAIGAGVAVTEARGSMVVDVGSGITEGVVISLGGIAASCSRRTGGDDLVAALTDRIRQVYGVEVGEATSERLLTEGSSHAIPFSGRDLRSGLPVRGVLSRGEIDDALRPLMAQIVSVAITTLERTPPELVADVAQGGLMLTGGASRLRGLARAIRDATGIPVLPSPHPDHDVIGGSASCLDDARTLAAALSG